MAEYIYLLIERDFCDMLVHGVFTDRGAAEQAERSLVVEGKVSLERMIDGEIAPEPL